MTLTEISYYGRRLLPFFIIFFLLILIFFYIVKLFFLYLQMQPQQKILKINPIYGKINKPVINEATTSPNFKYVLDTIEGEPTTATETAKVYPLPSTQARLRFYEQIYLIAKAAGFDTESIKHTLNGTVANFDDGKQKMAIDITNFNFTYEYRLGELKKENFFSSGVLPSEREIEDKAINFLNSVGRYPEELAQGKRNFVYLTYDPVNNQLIPAPQNQTSNMVEVDFYRPDIDALPQPIPVVSPSYFNSQNYVMIAFSGGSFKIIKSQMRFFEKSANEYGIYPLKTGNVAWEELIANKGTIISQTADEKTINIKKMFLGYYDPDSYQPYLQPVYVFLGENNFVAYVPAIENKYLTE